MSQKAPVGDHHRVGDKQRRITQGVVDKFRLSAWRVFMNREFVQDNVRQGFEAHPATAEHMHGVGVTWSYRDLGEG